MKTKLLKMSMLMAVLIFIVSGACWADTKKNRHHNPVQNKHIRSKQDRAAKYPKPAHFDQRWNQHRRHVYRNRRDYHHPTYTHRHKHRSSYRIFSFGTSVFDPGWKFIVVTKNRW